MKLIKNIAAIMFAFMMVVSMRMDKRKMVIIHINLHQNGRHFLREMV